MTIGTNVSFVLKALLLILLVVGMYFLVKAIRDYGPLRKLREKVDDIDRQRLLSVETEKQGFLERETHPTGRSHRANPRGSIDPRLHRTIL